MYNKTLINDKIKEQNLTSETLADKAKLNKNTISKARNGRNIKTDTLEKIAVALNISMVELFAKD